MSALCLPSLAREKQAAFHPAGANFLPSVLQAKAKLTVMPTHTLSIWVDQAGQVTVILCSCSCRCLHS